MKTKLVAIICCLSLLSLTGCSTSARHTNEAATESTSYTRDTSIHTEVTPPSTDYFDFSTSLYQVGDDINVFSESRITDFDAEEYTDTIAPEALNMDIFGTTYELQYANSAMFALTGQKVHVYHVQGTENGKVFIDIQTDKVMKYMNIPYTPTEATEDDYKQTIQTFVGDSFDLSQYEYGCSTLYISPTENGAESKEEPVFHVGDADDLITYYRFGYVKEIAGHQSPEHIVATFYDDCFTLEIVDLGYSASPFVMLLEYWSAYEASLYQFFSTITDTSYSVQSVESSDHIFFIRDGIPYVLSTAELTFERNGQEAYSTVVQAITSCVPQDR